MAIIGFPIGCASPATVSVVTTRPAAVDPPAGPGPTVQARVAGGYELANRDLRVVVSDRTGDVTWVGPAGSDVNWAGPTGVRAVDERHPDQSPVGQVEDRDEQSWQFVGDDPAGLRWRKTYSLDGDHLYASYLVQDTTKAPAAGRVQLRAGVPGGTVFKHDFEWLIVDTPAGRLTIHGFNLVHDAKVPANGVWVQSDVLDLKPGERLGYTTDWALVPAGMP